MDTSDASYYIPLPVAGLGNNDNLSLV